jgi:hypothetical protein
MDELQLVRELFYERPRPGPEVIAKARALMSAGKPPRRRVALRLGLPVAAVAAAAAVITAIAVQGPPAEVRLYPLPAGAAGAHVGTAASARGILLTAARTVGRAAPLRTGRFWVTQAVVGNFLRAGPADRAYVILEKVGTQQWAARSPQVLSPLIGQALGVQLASAADRAAWRRDGSPTRWNLTQKTSLADPLGYTDGFDFDIKAAPGPLTDFGSTRGLRPFQVGSQDLSAAQLLALPADPARLKALIMKEYDPTSGQSADSYLFQVTPVLLTMPVTPAVRAAFYQMLADLPGVRSLGQVRDTAGRDGVAVALSDRYRGCGNEMFVGIERPWRPTFSACVVQQRLVIDPDTGLPLAQELRYLKLPVGQDWSAPGGLFSYEIFGTARWTNANPPHYAN